MLSSTAILALVVSPSMGAYVGFNYGATFTTGAVKVQSDYETEFKAAQALVSAPQTFSSARLYTMIQGGTANSVIEAIPAAISTKTSLLLGLWASAGDANFANEIAALKSAIATYGSSGLDVAGISVGSEDLYRITPTGIANGENPGASPDTIVNYIGQVKSAIANTAFANVPVGHVDTWTAWVNGSNSAVAAACDFVGVDAYPYFQDTLSNSISDGQSLFNSAFDQTKSAVGGKPVWITETGWPVSGPTRNLAVASVENAKTYWDTVGCSYFGVTNTWWFTLQDASPATPSPSFGIVGSTLGSSPLYDLSCNASTPSSSSGASSVASTAVGGSTGSSTGEVVSSGSSASGSATASGTGASPSGGSGSGSGSGSTATVSSASGPGASNTSSSIVPHATSTSSGSAPSSSVVTTNSGANNVVSSAAAFAALLAASLML